MRKPPSVDGGLFPGRSWQWPQKGEKIPDKTLSRQLTYGIVSGNQEEENEDTSLQRREGGPSSSPVLACHPLFPSSEWLGGLSIARVRTRGQPSTKWSCSDEAHKETSARPYWDLRHPSLPPRLTILLHLPPVSTMEPKTQQPKEQGGTMSALNVLIEALNLAKEVSSITPAKAVFGSASILLTMIRVRLLLVLY